MSQRIGFTGPFSDVNFGDYAMLVNNYLDIAPDEAVLYAADSAFLHKVVDHYLSDSSPEVRPVDLRTGATEGLDLTDASLTPADALPMFTDPQALLDSVAALDVLVVNGGGYINGLWASPHRAPQLMQILGPVYAARRVGTPIVFTANGYGPFGAYEDFFFALLNDLPGVALHTRDDVYSPAHLRRLGVASERIQQVPDDLYFLSPGVPQARETDLPSEYVVIESYAPVEELAANLDTITRFVQTMRDVHGHAVVFLPLNLGRGGTDQAAFLAERVPDLHVVDIETHGFLPIETAAAVIGGASLVVSMRYHAAVLAIQLEVPVVSALRPVLGSRQYYHSKTYGLLAKALGPDIDQSLFLQNGMYEALDEVSSSFGALTSSQGRVIRSRKTGHDVTLKLERDALIRQIRGV
ncbi:polysaccharide pyruvyl transferase family protein [Oceanitalea stevensii]|uniref:Polysaccharide pyruvyl transferase family protein n=1 Tax=Oceanitalea stevensii TaxID=2763072 RepID=A0ABR8Z5D2_9MICO|nr:polysaccharide pyruvyl transferase family protein [Oceanitalea stevensii]MBD8063392.1 polysaccharide pyruvyl transferase family protein [Oceanitalea stevensii]